MRLLFISRFSFFRKCDCKLALEQNKYFISFIWINVPLILLSQSPLIDYSQKYSNQKEKVGENFNISLNEGNSSNYDNVLLTAEWSKCFPTLEVATGGVL